MNIKQLFIIMFLFLAITPPNSNASIIWSWSITSNSSTEIGTFTTDGDLVAGLAPAATYTISDFSLTSTSTTVPTGSVSGGEFTIGQPTLGFIWDGSNPTQFFRSSGNLTNGLSFTVSNPVNANSISFAINAFYIWHNQQFQFEINESKTANLSPNPPPTVTSITHQTPSTSSTDADSLVWRVTFSEDVTDVDTTDFTVSGTTATVTDVSSVSSTDIYDVTVSGGDLANLNATVTLSFSGGQNITDVIGNTLTNTTPTDTNDATFVVDNTAPTLAEVTAVTTPTTDTTPDYTFSSDKSGTITYGGDCSSSTTNALNGNNSITFNTLALGTHSNCTITVDSAGNASNSLAVTSFTIAYSVNTVSNTQTIEEDTPLIFSTANSNLISISDIEAEDAVGHPVTVTLTATNGTLTLNSTINLTFNSGDGTNDASMEFSGTENDINTALAGMSFTPTSNFNGNASVQIVVNDGTSTDDDTVNITVNAVNDTPTTADKTVTLNCDLYFY